MNAFYIIFMVIIFLIALVVTNCITRRAFRAGVLDNTPHYEENNYD